jgi:P4 family phage/plasmid primase-like protien
VIHDDDGRIDTTVSWQQGGLPRSDVEMASVTGQMMLAAGCPVLHGEQSSRWYMWDGSGRYAPQSVTFALDMSQRLAEWHWHAVEDTWSRVREQIAEMPEGERPRVHTAAVKNWAAHKSYRKRLHDDAGQKAIRSALAGRLPVDDNRMDAGTGRIVVDNGVIDIAQVLRDGYVALLPHDPDELVSRRMGKGVRWDPAARCPAFERFTHDSVPDPLQRAWLLWRTACTLFGRMPRKGFLNLIGETNSGKSTYTELIAWLAGSYAKTVPVETFLAKHASDAGFRQHELMGSRFVYTHEPNPGALYDVAMMKAITGRDRQSTAAKFQAYIEWFPQCTPFIGSNNPIRFKTEDDAMMGRQEAVLFQRGYERPDEDLLDHLKAERDGILTTLVEQIIWESRLGHVPALPDSIVSLRERMADDTEDALAFITEWLGEGRLHEVDKHTYPVYKCAPIAALYTHYRYWCEDNGTRPVPKRTFSAIVSRRYPRQKSGQWVFTGLAVTSSALRPKRQADQADQADQQCRWSGTQL